jgi:hypothetical protein
MSPTRAMDTDCWAHRHRELVPIESHHIWPLSAKGPNVKENRIRICSNAHSACHSLLLEMLKADTAKLPWTVRRRYGRKVRRLAEAGFQAIKTRTIVTP